MGSIRADITSPGGSTPVFLRDMTCGSLGVGVAFHFLSGPSILPAVCSVILDWDPNLSTTLLRTHSF